MKHIVTGVAVVAALLATPVLAADMAVKAPPAPLAPASSWTGCYLGANGGYAWNDGRSSYHDPNATADPINGLSPSVIPTPTDTGSSSWTGGGEVGCNWQVDPQAVLGVEADIDALHAAGSASTATGSPNSLVLVPGAGPLAFVSPSTATEQVTVHWLSTVRARAGLPVLSNRGLLFVTGGLAVGGVSASGSVNTFFNPPAATPFVTWGGSNTSTQAGFVVGAGFEYALADHWTAKTEYLYYDLGDASHPLVPTFNCCVAGPFATLGNPSAHVHGSILRLGLNYQFNTTPGH
jgi:outer membrane immunogenic protein